MIFSCVYKKILQNIIKEGQDTFFLQSILSAYTQEYLFLFFLFYDEEIFEHTRTLCTNYDE